jgi:hypothetical protein
MINAEHEIRVLAEDVDGFPGPDADGRTGEPMETIARVDDDSFSSLSLLVVNYDRPANHDRRCYRHGRFLSLIRLIAMGCRGIFAAGLSRVK